jgi:glycosyltransferase involved in cell wall biosynthesis
MDETMTMATANSALVSIIIRTKNEGRFIGATLKRIFEQVTSLNFEVLIVDSGSTDNTLTIVAQFPVHLVKISPGEFTYGYALNYGARLTDGDYIVNLSAHCAPIKCSWLEDLVTPLSSNHSVAATYGKQVPIRGHNPFEERTTLDAFRIQHDGGVKAIFSNANCAIKRKVWEIHPFDEKAPFAEDFIWAKQVSSEKFEIRYVDEAAVFHSHAFDLRFWSKRYYDNALLSQYLRSVYELTYPWQQPRLEIRYLPTIARAFITDFWKVGRFFLENRYYRYIPIIPIEFLLRHYFSSKGRRVAAKLYPTRSM